MRISIAAGEPGVLARREAMYSTAWLSVVWSIIITFVLAGFMLPMAAERFPQTRALETLLVMTAGVFFSAMFLLVWWLEYRKRMDAIERAALQATVIVITPDQLLVETVGPFGKASETIAPPVDIFARRMPGTRTECLHIVAQDGKTTHLFPGLAHEELLLDRRRDHPRHARTA